MLVDAALAALTSQLRGLVWLSLVLNDELSLEIGVSDGRTLTLASVSGVLLDATEVSVDAAGVWLDSSTTTGAIAADVLMEVVVSGAVLEDLVLLLQPLRANPARSNVNNTEFFIGGLYCFLTDLASLPRFGGSHQRKTHENRKWGFCPDSLPDSTGKVIRIACVASGCRGRRNAFPDGRKCDVPSSWIQIRCPEAGLFPSESGRFSHEASDGGTTGDSKKRNRR